MVKAIESHGISKTQKSTDRVNFSILCDKSVVCLIILTGGKQDPVD